MDDSKIFDIPLIQEALEIKSKEIGFSMPSDLYIGSLLKTLIGTKPNGHFLELGTGIGLSLSWMIAGMDDNSTLISVDKDLELIKIAQNHFGHDKRIEIICQDGTKWVKSYQGNKFDLIFADAWPGKYSELDELLDLLKIGGLYIIDDMLPQPNWPDGHQKKAERLIAELENRDDLNLTKMNWSTGVIVAVKKS